MPGYANKMAKEAEAAAKNPMLGEGLALEKSKGDIFSDFENQSESQHDNA